MDAVPLLIEKKGAGLEHVAVTRRTFPISAPVAVVATSGSDVVTPRRTIPTNARLRFVRVAIPSAYSARWEPASQTITAATPKIARLRPSEYA